jgi:hypothetical protein
MTRSSGLSLTPGDTTGHWASDLCRDLRYAVRLLRKQVGFTATAVVILALGIGASTAMFSVVDAVLLRPLPYPSAERVVTLWGRSKQMSITSVSLPDYRDWQQRSHSFEHLALVRTDDAPVSVQDDRQMATTALVTANFFRVFNLSAQIGRTLTVADDTSSRRPATSSARYTRPACTKASSRRFLTGHPCAGQPSLDVPGWRQLR